MARNRLSTKSDFYISKFRRLELNNYCRQYSEWKRELNNISFIRTKEIHVTTSPSSPVENVVALRQYYKSQIGLIDDICREIAGENDYILKEAVTEGVSYDALEARHGTLRLARTSYYKMQRKFFYILDSRKKHLLL